eukprot:TRINITY_DN87914_c0_g1_i1.p1 TRINITY_DN87914_c0_g1~~TRINITY_DN87914_c0_g1_i1.p1  ORF type:complete len:480 (+),score=76.02 TRINITY_DN87914_c0_g1_i1:113-1552(+)
MDFSAARLLFEACDTVAHAADAAILPAANFLGHPCGLVKMAAGLTLAVPCGFLLGLGPTAVSRHVMSSLLGLLLVVALFGAASLSLVATTVLTWAAMCCFRERAGPVVFAGNMVYLIYLHVRQASGLAWKEGHLDHTGAQMIVTLKLISAAFNLADGCSTQVLSDFQQAKALVELPNLVAFLGYALNPTTTLAAPGCEMSDYLAWARRQGAWAEVHSAVLPCLRAMAEALAYFFVFWVLSPRLPETSMYQDDIWVSKPLWWRTGWLFAFMVALRCKFYVAWKLSEAATNASGLGFTGFDERGHACWEGGINVHPLRFELADSAVLLPAHWNIQTGRWLRHYVYERVKSHNQRATFACLLATQVVSGLWHGLHAGYCLFFFCSAFMLQASKMVHRQQQRWLQSNGSASRLASVLHWFLVHTQINFLAQAFVLLQWETCWEAWQRMQFLGLRITIALWIVNSLVLLLPGGDAEQEQLKKRH